LNSKKNYIKKKKSNGETIDKTTFGQEYDTTATMIRFKDRENYPTGCAFATFPTPQLATLVVETLNKRLFLGREVHVS